MRLGRLLGGEIMHKEIRPANTVTYQLLEKKS